MHCVWDVAAHVTDLHRVSSTEPGLEGARLLLAESVSGLAEKFPDVHVTLELARGLPEQCLIQAGERMDLVVVGRHFAHHPLAQFVVGGVATTVLEHSSCVVAVVPES